MPKKKSLQKKRKVLKKKKAQARKNAETDFKLGIREGKVKKGSANEAGLKAVISISKKKKPNPKKIRSL
jgi:hypothetical protein